MSIMSYDISIKYFGKSSELDQLEKKQIYLQKYVQIYTNGGVAVSLFFISRDLFRISFVY